MSPSSDYDLIVLDEFHRVGAEKWGEGVARLLELNPNAKVLGTSATHIRYLDNERNMADELFDGKVVSYLPLKMAIDEGILPNPTYVSTLYEVDTISSQIKKNIESANNDADWKNTQLRKLDGLAHSWGQSKGVPHIISKYFTKDMQRIIVFCSKVEKVEEYRLMLGRWLTSAGYKRIRFYSIDYKEAYLEKEMADFQEPCEEGQLKVAMSVNMLNEGVHVPRVDGIIMLRSTVSRIIIEQQVGRCLTADNKGRTPIVLDLVNNMETVKYDSAYMFEDSPFMGSEEQSEKKSDGFPFHVIDECRDIRIFLHELDRQIATRGADVEETLKGLMAWVEENGKVINISCPYYEWFKDLNRDHRSPYFRELYERLKSMGLVLTSELSEQETWMQKHDKVMAYKAEFGELPKSNNAPYGTWMHNQKTMAKHGELDDERTEIVFRDFFVKEPTEEEIMQQIRDYYKEHGTLPFRVGKMGTMLDKFRLNKFKLEHLDWANELVQMGYSLRIPYFFSVGYPIALANFNANGGKIVYESPNCYMRRWCVAMRNYRNANRLSEEQLAKCTELGVFDSRVRIMGEVIDEIEREVRESGKTSKINNRNKQYIQLHREEILADEEYSARMKALGFFRDFDAENMALTEAFYKEHGHLPRHREDTQLYAWRSRIRRRNKAEHAQYLKRFKEMGEVSIEEVREQNKKMVVDWLRENKRMPLALKGDKENVEYRCYTCIHTWIKAKGELKLWITAELAKYGIEYNPKGLTAEDYRKQFMRDFADFVTTNGRMPTKADGNIGALTDRYRRKALRENDTELIAFFEKYGLKVDVSTKYEDMFNKKIEAIVTELRKVKTISVKHPLYNTLKHYSNRLVGGELEDYKVKKLRETHFILEDGTFCTYTSGREYVY